MKWMITVNRKDYVDFIILILLFMQITVFSFFDIRGTGNILILLAVFIRIFVATSRTTYKLKIIIALLVMWAIYTLSALTGLSFQANCYVSNLLAVIFPIAPVIYIAWISLYKKDFLYRFMIQLFPLFNVFYIINLVVVYLQSKIPFFLSGFSETVNTYIPDLMSGLFGYNGTAQLGLYSIFVLIYNIVCLFYVFDLPKTNKIIAKIYILFIIASIIITCANNDNKAVYIAVFLYILLALVIILNKKQARKRAVYKMGLVVVFVGLIAGMKYIITYKLDWFAKVSDELISTIALLRTFINDPSSYMSGEIGSMERIYMVAYAFHHPDTLLLGGGSAFANWQTSGTFGFPHFGQSDLSSFLCLGGLVFTIVIFVFYFMLYVKITNIPRYNKVIYMIVLLLVFVLYFGYTQPWTQTTINICLVMTCIAVGMLVDCVGIKQESKDI